MIFALHTLRLVGLGGMVIKPKQSSFPLTKNLKSTSQSSIRRSLSTNLKFATLKRWNCMPQTLQSVVDFCFSVIWIERLMWRGKSKTWLLQCTIAVTFVHPHVNVRIGFLLKQWIWCKLKSKCLQVSLKVDAVGLPLNRNKLLKTNCHIFEHPCQRVLTSFPKTPALDSLPSHQTNCRKLWNSEHMFLRKQMSGMPVWHKKSLLFLATLMNNLRKLDLDFLNLVWHRFWNQNILF